MSSETAKSPTGGAGSRRVNERRSLDLISVEGVVKRENMLSAWKQVKGTKGLLASMVYRLRSFPYTPMRTGKELTIFAGREV